MPCTETLFKDSVFFSLGVLKYVCMVCARGVMEDVCVFFVCIVTRGAVGARAWEA